MAQEVQVSHVEFVTEGAIAWIRLNRPDKLNPLSGAARDAIGSALKAIERDAAVRVVVIIGSGRAFSAGADLGEINGRSPEEIGLSLREDWLPVLNRVRTLPKPVICGMNGLAAGVAASLALACDIRVAADDASFIEAFVNIGLVPDGGVSWLLPRLVGRGVAMEMFMTGRPLSAAEALGLGAVNKVVAKDQVEAECRALAERLAAMPAFSLAGAKRAVNFAENSTFEAAVEFEGYLQEVAAASGDHVEGVAAFKEKRPARFGTTS